VTAATGKARRHSSKFSDAFGAALNGGPTQKKHLSEARAVWKDALSEVRRLNGRAALARNMRREDGKRRCRRCWSTRQDTVNTEAADGVGCTTRTGEGAAPFAAGYRLPPPGDRQTVHGERAKSGAGAARQPRLVGRDAGRSVARNRTGGIPRGECADADEISAGVSIRRGVGTPAPVLDGRSRVGLRRDLGGVDAAIQVSRRARRDTDRPGKHVGG